MEQYRVIQLEDYLPLKILRLLNQHGPRKIDDIFTRATKQEINVLHRYNRWRSFIKNKGKFVDVPKVLKWEPHELIDMFFFIKQNVSYYSYKYDCNNWEASEHLHLSYNKHRQTVDRSRERKPIGLLIGEDDAEERSAFSPPPSKRKRIHQKYMVCWNCSIPFELSKSIVYSKPLSDYFFMKFDHEIDRRYRNFYHSSSSCARLFKYFEEAVDLVIPETLSKKLGEDWESWLFMGGEVQSVDEEPFCFITLETLHPVNSEKYFKKSVYWKQFEMRTIDHVRTIQKEFEAFDPKGDSRFFRMTDVDSASINPNRLQDF